MNTLRKIYYAFALLLFLYLQLVNANFCGSDILNSVKYEKRTSEGLQYVQNQPRGFNIM
jgi:hypothetical protein